ncbi:hypothetical protein HDU76_010730, partial [Blyttiomyces sp. JEL0837]
GLSAVSIGSVHSSSSAGSSVYKGQPVRPIQMERAANASEERLIQLVQGVLGLWEKVEREKGVVGGLQQQVQQQQRGLEQGILVGSRG